MKLFFNYVSSVNKSRDVTDADLFADVSCAPEPIDEQNIN